MNKKVKEEVIKIIGPAQDIKSLNEMIEEFAQDHEVLHGSDVQCLGGGYRSLVTYLNEISVEEDSLVAVIPEKFKFLDWIRFRILWMKLKIIAVKYDITLDRNFYSQLDRLTGKQGEVIFSKRDDSAARWRIIAR